MGLVRVHADSQLAGLDGCLIDANSRAAGGSKDNVKSIEEELERKKKEKAKKIAEMKKRLNY